MFTIALYSLGLNALQFMMVISWIKLYQYKQSNNKVVTVNGMSSTHPVPAAEVLSGILDGLHKNRGCPWSWGGCPHTYAAASQPPMVTQLLGWPWLLNGAGGEQEDTADVLAGK